MATPIYSKQLAATSYDDASPHDIYTVPAGRLAIVRDLDILANITGTGLLFMQLSGVDAKAFTFTSAGIDSLEWRGRQVLNEGEALSFVAPGLTSGRYFIVASGYEFSVP